MTGLETGIQRLVDEFIAAGRPNARLQPLNERRQGYEASVVLAGPAAEVCTQELELEGIRLRRYLPDTPGPWPTLIYFHGGCFVAGSFVTHEQQLSYLACHGKARLSPSTTAWHRNTAIRQHTTMRSRPPRLYWPRRRSYSWIRIASLWAATVPAAIWRWSPACA